MHAVIRIGILSLVVHTGHRATDGRMMSKVLPFPIWLPIYVCSLCDTQ